MANFAGARAKLATATQDLFRLSGSHSIPVEASTSEPPAPSVPDSPLSSARKPEASIMFSLEALMKANQTPPPGPAETLEEASSQLWNMQSAEPLFGTAHDQALLTTPLKMEPAQSMDSMTLPSETPHGRRLWPILLAAGAGLALAGGGIWMFGPSRGTTANAATPSSEHALLAAQLPAPAEAPAPPVEAAAPSVEATPPAAAELPPTPTSDAPAEGEKPPVLAAAVEPAASSKDAPKEKEKEKPSARKPPPRAVPTSTKAAFDKGAAKTALASAASAAAACGAGGAPAKGKIQVTFAPTGKVSDAQLVEGPFAGTTAGKCAMRHFRAAKVPAFSGAAVTVAKSFKVD